MSLREYDVEINGVQTTLQLSDEDAKELGLTAKKAAPAPANKAAKAPANKSAAQSKRDEIVGKSMNKPSAAKGDDS